MTHRTIYLFDGNTARARNSFERHLREYGRGSARVGGAAHRQVMLENIGRSFTKYRFPVAARAEVLSGLYSSFDPEKSLMALGTLGKMALLHTDALRPFLETARKWHGDLTMRELHPNDWLAGENFIRTVSRILTMPKQADSGEDAQAFQRAAGQ